MSFRSNFFMFVFAFAGFYLIIFIQHEMNNPNLDANYEVLRNIKRKFVKLKEKTTAYFYRPSSIMEEIDQDAFFNDDIGFENKKSNSAKEQTADIITNEKRGLLKCDGQYINSEIIYWKQVPGDIEYESPITPHHHEHDERYLTFEYDHGGWNNMRMGVESLVVVAHAMGRTLVIPPQQHLYLISSKHKDKGDEKAHDEMGFEDFYDIDLLKSQKGFHMMHMDEFLTKEGITGNLHGIHPPLDNVNIWGGELWKYLAQTADITPAWFGKFLALPDRTGDFNLTQQHHPRFEERLKAFRGQGHNDRQAIYYDETLQRAHHIHIQGNDQNRILQHPYAFIFFASPAMTSFYKRFVRDFMRYKSEIQCPGAALVAAIRKDSQLVHPHNNGEYYALHIRRGDLQFKEVKLSSADIVKNLHLPNGTALIPRGSYVYIATDDPDGVCRGCRFKGKPCESYKSPLPVGCMEDPSWNAFLQAGWTIRFLRDFIKTDPILRDMNPNIYGMVETIGCSRAKVFAGTYFSTFTGYIHRLRGYHGLGEETYYHSEGKLMVLRDKRSIGHGWTREWRAGWTDEEGGLI